MRTKEVPAKLPGLGFQGLQLGSATLLILVLIFQIVVLSALLLTGLLPRLAALLATLTVLLALLALLSLLLIALLLVFYFICHEIVLPLCAHRGAPIILLLRLVAP